MKKQGHTVWASIAREHLKVSQSSQFSTELHPSLWIRSVAKNQQKKAKCMKFLQTKSATQGQRQPQSLCVVLRITRWFVGLLCLWKRLWHPEIYRIRWRTSSNSRLQELQSVEVYGQDGAEPHWNLNVRAYFNKLRKDRFYTPCISSLSCEYAAAGMKHHSCLISYMREDVTRQ